MNAPAEPKDSVWKIVLVGAALAILTLAVFSPALRNDFVDWDDNDYIRDNPMVTRGLSWEGVVWAFTHARSANWHPLTWISHMVDCQLYGTKPLGHHLTSVIIHAAAVVGLFLVLRRITGAFYRSAFVAAVFAIHPLRVESVAWAAERKDVLSGLFFVLTLGAYAHFATGPRSKWRYLLVMVVFALGLMSKPMLVTVPFILLVLDFWPLRRSEPLKILLMEKIPLCLLSVACCVATVLAQGKAMHSGEAYSLPLRIENAAGSIAIYLWQFIWPARLAAYYPFPLSGIPLWEIIASVVVITGLSVVAWRERKTRPWLTAGWVWYLVMLLPVIGIVQVGAQAHADRYTYLPQIGIAIAATWTIADLARREIAAVLALASLGVMAVLTVNQTGHWRNGETLWRHTLACTNGNAMAFKNLGDWFLQNGNIDEATANYSEALRVNANFAEAHKNLGIAYIQKGDFGNAITETQASLQTVPDDATAHLNLGIALFRSQRINEAIKEFQSAIDLGEGTAGAHYSLATALLQTGRMDDAAGEYIKALQLRPNYIEAHANLGNILAQQGNGRAAATHLEAALNGAPGNPSLENSLAWVLATATDSSVRDGKRAVELAGTALNQAGGTNAMILHTLAAALAEAGRFEDAQIIIAKAVALARDAGQNDFVEKLNRELYRYQAKKPLHE